MKDMKLLLIFLSDRKKKPNQPKPTLQPTTAVRMGE